jgi:hypothetical protein
VDGFIESVYQEFAGTEFEETRETLRGIWTAVLSVTSPRGDASLFPNKNGARRAAAMKVWHKAGDYWRRGLRLGDVLPDIAPACKITRTEDGWIALFPKDAALLESEECRVKSEELSEQSATLQQVGTEEGTHQDTPQGTPTPSACPSVQPQEEAPVSEDERQREYVALMTERKRQRLEREAEQRRRREERMAREEQERQQQRTEKKRTVLKAVGLFAAACAVCVVIYETGFLIPLGLIGLATSGLVK